jgi:WD40 repeat protein
MATSGATTITLLDVPTGRIKATLEGPRSGVNCLALSPDGKTLASGCSDRTIKLWDVATYKCVKNLKGHLRPVKTVAFNKTGRILASGSRDRTIMLWAVPPGR